MAVAVGQYNPNRRIIRAPVNPMDKSTVVSIYPKEIREVKHTIQPGIFVIPKGSYETPATLVVGPSSWWREIDEEQPLLEIPNSSIQIADSIVKDYCVGLLAYSGDQASPGLFYVMGEYDSAGIQKNFKKELDLAAAKQRKWYQILMEMADSLWARSNGNPLAISDDMRLAARELGKVDNDWMKDFRMVDMTRCPACGSLRNPQYPICATCKYIDPAHPLAKDMKFAQ